MKTLVVVTSKFHMGMDNIFTYDYSYLDESQMNTTVV
jgi:hypothetical protein